MRIGESMIELIPSEFSCVLPLLAGIHQAVLPYAICDGINPGRVFVDQRVNPRTTLIWTPVGYYFLAGEPAQARDLKEIGQVLTDIFVPASQASGETGFILIPSSAAWRGYLSTLLPGREFIEIYRRPHIFDLTQFTAQVDWQRRIPQGFRLQPVDATLAEQVGVLASWASIDDYLAYGLGFALLEGDEIASVCTSVFASSTGMEIDVHTAEKYRRRGLAVLVTSAFIETCLQRGKQPNWECFWDNEPSTALAGKLGFVPLPDYRVYFWEE
jgi:RimJ/RimL family protein N-acetyltransferase